MAFENDFATFLAASSRVQDAMGTASPGARIQMSVLPQDVTYPAIRYERISTQRFHTQDGPDGKPIVRMQVDCFGKNGGSVVDLAEAVRKAVDGFKGTMGTAGVDASFNDDEDAFFETDSETYRVRQDYMIRHGEATS